MSLHSGIWFFFANQLTKKVSVSLAWLAATVGYFFFMDHYILWIFGVAYGYPFGNPLILLSVYPSLLFLLTTLTRYGLLSCIILFSWYMSAQTRGQKYVSFLCMIPFFTGFIIGIEDVVVPKYVQRIVIITPSKVQRHPLDIAQEIAHKITLVSQRYKRSNSIIIMPESSYPFPLNQQLDIVELWQTNSLIDKQTVIIGSHKIKNKKLFNSAYLISKCRIMQTYDKIKPTPITECINFPLNKINFLKKLLLHDREPFNVGSSFKKFHIQPNITFCPYICSDLFFSPKMYTKKTPLFLINDSWFQLNYIPRLMLYHAIFKTIEWQTSSIYVGHSNGIFIDKTGSQIPLFKI
ncbi:hypothetical protein KC460_00975 [Candidatus Dependentiae bacterium]|nr:hypothetical protein [Candidatus Dependentiae bacterium]